MTRLATLLFCLQVLSAHAQPLAPPPIAARAYYLVDLLGAKELAAQSADDRFEPASLTKLMTAYVVFGAIRDKKLDPASMVTVSERAWKPEGSRMFIEPRKPVAVSELLRGMIVQSGNDAAIALAEATAGTEEAFVQLMNREAQRLGLKGTSFRNSTGLPAPEHYATARDMANLAAALIRDFPADYALYSQKEFTYNKITQSNRNRLLWIDPTVDGVKTGFTEAAGYCLVTSARRGQRRLVSVVMGAQTDALRISESQKLLNFGFLAYDTQRVYQKGQVVASPAIYKGTSNAVKIGFNRDVYLTLARDRFTGIKADLVTQHPFIAPYSVGQKAGIMKLTREGALLAELPVVALEEVPVAGFLSRGWDTIRLLFE